MTSCSLNKLYLQLMPYVAKPHLLKFSHLAIKTHARLTTTVVKLPLLHTTCVTQTPVQLASYVALPLQWLSQSVNFCTGYNQDCGGLTVDNVCKVWTKKLEDAGIPDPKISVDLIVAHAMGKKMLHEVSNDAQVDENTARHIKDMCEWRMDRCPVQYIIKEWDFHDLTLKMRPPVFIPRPETEELADLVCKSVRSRGLDNHHNVRFLEIGCGSGAISLYILHQLSKVEGLAIDKGIQACELTQENAELCHVSDRINIQNLDFTSDDAFQTLKEYGRFDIIVSNPPYIPTEEIPQLEPEVSSMMPRKKFWRRGANKKGDSHPSKHGLTSDNDMGAPPIQKKEVRDSDMGTPPIQKKEQRDCLGTRPSNAPYEVYEQTCTTLRNELYDHVLRNEPNYHNVLRNEPNNHNVLRNEPNYHNVLRNEPNNHIVLRNKPNFHTSHGHESSFYRTVGNESGVQEHHVNDPVHCIFASHSQADTRYSNFSRGRQCTCMSLSMILSLVEDQQFSATILDQVLDLGDNLYKKVMMDLKNAGKYRSDLLSFDELPTTVEYRNNFYNITKHRSVCGLPVINSATSGVISLHKGVLQALSKSQYLLVMIGAICSAVAKRGDEYIFFDSHSHGSDGLSSPDGNAVMMRFLSYDDLVAFLYSFYLSSNIDLSCQFEILPVTVQLITHRFLNIEPCQMLPPNRVKKPESVRIESQHSNLKAVFKTHTFLKENSNVRQSYMRKYMQRKRKCDEFRKIEREKEVEGKHNARADDQYRDRERKREAQGKRMARDVEQYRVSEQKKQLLTKQKARTDANVRQRELLGKRKARDDKQYREKERKREVEGKQKARNVEQFRVSEQKKQLLSKQKARTDANVRQRELLCKRKARDDKQYRDKERKREVEGKQKARDDKQYRDKERKREVEGKQKARDDKQYRDKERKREVEGKQKARDVEQFRVSEQKKQLLSKQKARTDANVRQRELLCKRKARDDKQYRDKERQKEIFVKRKARLDEQFKLKERIKGLQSKQRARMDKLFLECERLKKQEVRNAKTHFKDRERKSDKNRKNMERTNENFVKREKYSAKKKKHGSTIQESIENFHSATNSGPLYICTCCHQTWFFESVSKVETVASNTLFPEGMLTGFKSVQDKEWICRTCLSNIKKDKVPKLSVLNGMKWPDKPVELNLHPLEERLVSLRIPFMQIRELPRGGQYCIKGNVVNVPVDIQPAVNALPRQMDEHFTIPVKLKKKLSYKKCDFSENVRPAAVLSALHWLMSGSELYRNSGVTIDSSWEESVTKDGREIAREFLSNKSDEKGDRVQALNSCRMDELGQIEENNLFPENIALISTVNNEQKEYESDNFSEVDSAENVIGNADTLLEDVSLNTDRSYAFAPGEGQHPLSLYSDHDAEFLSFPSIFCGQKRPENKDRIVPVHYTDVAKWELRSRDRRAAQSVPNIFFKLKRIQLKQISDKVHLAVRRYKTKGKKITAAEARDQSNLDRIVRLDEGYYIFRQLRNSPAYLASRKKDVFAMIRQLGLPTWFMSLSSADTRWPELLKTLAKLNENIVLSDSDIENMSWMQKSKLVQRDPVTCSRFFDHRVQQFINLFLKSQHNPIGKFTDFFYRVEFQQRGSPHIHMLVWIDDAPKYPKHSEDKIVEYVEQFLTCSNANESMTHLLSLQTHKHSKTCRKKGKAICRFGFPLPPLKQTKIMEPLETDVDKYKKKYDMIQQKVNNFKEGMSLSYEQFLDEIAEMSEEEYIKCIRSSLSGPKLFLRRAPSEMRVNMYNEHLLEAWNANIDIQFVLDPFACAMYIVSYISKSQRGMSALLDRACKEARHGNMDIKKQVRHIGNQFLNSVEVSAQEACYLVLQMPLTKASRDVIFINTSPPHERVLLLKQQSKLEELNPDSTEVHCQNIIERYSKRPRQIENWCLADYASQLEIKYPEGNEIEHFLEEVNEDDPNHDESENMFTSDDTLVTLKNGIIIRKRQHDLILRYVHYSLKNDPENHYREKLLLFMPWRHELTDLLGGLSSYKDYYKEKQYMIQNKARKYEKNLEEIEQAMQAAQEEFEQHDELAPNAQQTNAEDEVEGSQESEQYVQFNPDRPLEHRYYDIGTDLGVTTSTPIVNSSSERIPDDEFMKFVRGLNIKQREFFNHVVHWIKTKDEPLYAFLSGGAGVGKSVVIKAIHQALHRHLHSVEGEDPDDIRILLCAFTGKAAYNINGVTIASAFHKKYNQLNQSMSSDELNSFRMKYRNLALIIIDEISMVGNKMLNFINTRLKELRGVNKAFGGISIIAVGDLYQLQPVGDSWIFNDLSNGPEILATNLWKEYFRMFELTQIMRQRDDSVFADLLNRLRTNALTEEDKAEIQQHIVSPYEENYPRDVPHLFIENKFVDSFNEEFIKRLSTVKVTVECHDTVLADIPKKNKDALLRCLPKDASKTANLTHSLILAVGMIYEITVNLDVNDGLANGSTCIVKCIQCRIPQTTRPSIVWVLFTDNNIGSSNRQKYHHLYQSNIDPSWTPLFDVNRNFMYNYKAYQRIQFPLKPAAAKTVHKAQGCTVDKLVIDLSQTRTRKTPHIHYVAMSRVRKLENLAIVNFNEAALCVDERVKAEMERLQEDAKMTLCFLPLYSIDSSKFKMALNNARSLHKHFVEVSKEPSMLAANVIGITESRLCPADDNERYSIAGFNIIRNDQVTTNSTRRPYHGLAMYIKIDSECNRIIKHSTDTYEFLLCDVKDSRVGYVQIVLLYKSPLCSLSEFKEKTVSHLCPHVNPRKSLIIMGDFNFDISSGNFEFLKFMADTFQCSQHVQKSTTNMGSVLDLVFSNFSSISTEVIECYWSDHKIVTAFV